MRQYEMFELSLRGAPPSDSEALADVEASFTTGCTTQTVKGFYDGDGVYKVRYYPSTPGFYTWKVSGAVTAEGAGECVSSQLHGLVQAEGCHFVFQDGTRFAPFGTTVYALIHQPQALIGETMETLRTAPFNKLRFCVFPKSYEYNHNEPEEYPFHKDATGNWNVHRPNHAFWRRLEVAVGQLSDMEIQSDLILFHAYDRWGFSKMTREQNEVYLRYALRRLSAFPSIWWSMANEYELCFAKSVEDWRRFEEIIREEDAYGHLLSNHYCVRPYDYTRKNITHLSLQNVLFYKADQWMKQFGKPVVFDECCYEGDISQSWGNISAREMTHRFWCACCLGAYATHGETYLSDDEVLWWAKGGKLKGESPKRIAFLREIVEALPAAIEPWQEPEYLLSEGEMCGYPVNDQHPIFALLASLSERENDSGLLKDKIFAGHCNEDAFIKYFGRHCPRRPFLMLPESKTYRIDVIDTWNMTRETVLTGASGVTWVELKTGREGIALLANAE